MQHKILVIIAQKEAVVLFSRTTASFYSTGNKDKFEKDSNTAFFQCFTTVFRTFNNLLPKNHYFRPGLVARPLAVVLLIEGQGKTLESQQEVAA